MAGSLISARSLGLAMPFLLAGLSGCAASTSTTRLADLASAQQRADAAYVHHDWRTAVDEYRALARAAPDHAAYWFRLGNSYARLDQPQPAADAYRAALQRDPRLAPAWHNLGSVLLKQAQAAYAQAAANAAQGDSLKAASARLATRIRAVRSGASGEIPSPSATSGQAPGLHPADSANAASGQGGGP